jgi:hypothetical protein
MFRFETDSTMYNDRRPACACYRLVYRTMSVQRTRPMKRHGSRVERHFIVPRAYADLTSSNEVIVHTVYITVIESEPKRIESIKRAFYAAVFLIVKVCVINGVIGGGMHHMLVLHFTRRYTVTTYGGFEI